MTRSDFEEIIRLVCPHCRNGLAAVLRQDTNEWTHTTGTAHTICWASGFRTSRFGKGLADAN